MPSTQSDVEIEAPLLRDLAEPPLFLRSTQAAVDVFAYRYPGSDEPIGIGVTDVPVIAAATDHRTPERRNSSPSAAK